VVQHALYLLTHYKVQKKLLKSMDVVPLVIEKSKPWGFFDGACQRNKNQCGIVFLLYFSDSSYISGYGNLGRGTNNQAKFQALLELMDCVKSFNLDSIHIYGNSKLAIDWMNGVATLVELELVSIGSILKEASTTFPDISYKHIFLEHNTSAD
jgi:ribonuclease HI